LRWNNASRAQAFRRVFFQLSMPGVASAGLLVFISSLGFFITRALLDGPHDTLLGQLIIQQIMTLQNWQLAGAIASMLIASVLLTCLVYDRLFGLSAIAGGSTVKQRGRGAVRRFGMAIAARAASLRDMAASALGPRSIDWLLPAYAWTLVLLLLPIIATIPMAFTSASFLSFPPPGLSLRWFVDYATSEVWVAATLRSFGIGLVSGCLTLLLAAPGAYTVVRGSSRLGTVVFMLFVTPMVVPSIVIAVALFYRFAQIGLVATNLGIIIGHTVTGIPLAFVILLAVLRGYDWSLNQAAATLGTNRARDVARNVAAGQGRDFRRVHFRLPQFVRGTDGHPVRRRRTKDHAAEAEVRRRHLVRDTNPGRCLRCRAVGCHQLVPARGVSASTATIGGLRPRERSAYRPFRSSPARSRSAICLLELAHSSDMMPPYGETKQCASGKQSSLFPSWLS
jgi:ABC-type spermidine/putrescine transport system permease subunit II